MFLTRQYSLCPYSTVWVGQCPCVSVHLLNPTNFRAKDRLNTHLTWLRFWGQDFFSLKWKLWKAPAQCILVKVPLARLTEVHVLLGLTTHSSRVASSRHFGCRPVIYRPCACTAGLSGYRSHTCISNWLPHTLLAVPEIGCPLQQPKRYKIRSDSKTWLWLGE